MNKRPRARVCWILLPLLATGFAARAQDASEAGRVGVTGVTGVSGVSGEGEKPSTGLVADDDMARASSAASKAQFDKLRASVNPFPVMTLLSGANLNNWDTIDLFASKLPYSPQIKAHQGTVTGLTGSLQVSPEVRVFSSLSKSVKLTGSPETIGPGGGWQAASGAGTAAGLFPLRSRLESAVALDMGALYKSNLFKASATAFLVKFKDRIASSFEPATGAAPNLRVSSAVARGVELEVGTLPVQGFSVHASATYIQGYSDNSLPMLANPLAVLGDAGKVAAQFPASGRLFPDAPQSIAALSVQYAKGPVLVNLVGKYNGRRNITVVGEQSLAGFTTFDLNVALPLPSDRWFSSPTLRLDVSNVTNKRFLLPSQHGIAPRLTSITLQSDF